jgi:hypothetical protein
VTNGRGPNRRALAARWDYYQAGLSKAVNPIPHRDGAAAAVP